MNGSIVFTKIKCKRSQDCKTESNFILKELALLADMECQYRAGENQELPEKTLNQWLELIHKQREKIGWLSKLSTLNYSSSVKNGY